ncbi:MAG: RNA polymerase sigma factor region1.1 domain-containing protein, partial [Methylocella sp.]
MAKKDSANPGTARGAVEVADGPLLDLTDAAVKRMIKLAKKRGFVTYADLNAVLPSEEVNSEQIEDILAMLSEMGINVIENEEHDDASPEESAEEEETEGGDLVETAQAKAVTARSSEPADRTDDPVRMYLREMGSVELLSREGEIAIAKRIEAGREAMIAGLCESPLTFQAIIIWRDEVNDCKVPLRDIIDLEATYAGPDGKNTPKIDMTAPGAAEALTVQQAPAIAPLDPPARLRPASEDGGADAPIPDEVFDEEDDMDNSVSLSAMEAELKPK